MHLTCFTCLTIHTFSPWYSLSEIEFLKLILVIIIFFIHSVLQSTFIYFIVYFLHVFMPVILNILNLLLSIFNFINNHFGMNKWLFYVLLHLFVFRQDQVHYFFFVIKFYVLYKLNKSVLHFPSLKVWISSLSLFCHFNKFM